MTDSGFEQLLAAAAFAQPGWAMQVKQALPIPAASDEGQAQVKTQLASETHGKNFREADGETAKEYNRMVDEIYGNIQGSVSGVKNLPPKPKLYLYENDIPNSTSLTSDKGDATGIAANSRLWKELSPAERKEVVAHEVAHRLIESNPELLQNFVPANPEAVKKDLERLNIPIDPNDTRYVKYITEVAADDLAMRMTHNPKEFAATMKHMEKIREQDYNKNYKEALADEHKRTGHSPTDEEKEQIKKGLNIPQALEDYFNPHPSNQTRIDNAHMLEKILKSDAHDQGKDGKVPPPTPPSDTPGRPVQQR